MAKEEGKQLLFQHREMLQLNPTENSFLHSLIPKNGSRNSATLTREL